jgi:hypothetical protein
MTKWILIFFCLSALQAQATYLGIDPADQSGNCYQNSHHASVDLYLESFKQALSKTLKQSLIDLYPDETVTSVSFSKTEFMELIEADLHSAINAKMADQHADYLIPSMSTDYTNMGASGENNPYYASYCFGSDDDESILGTNNGKPVVCTAYNINLADLMMTVISKNSIQQSVTRKYILTAQTGHDGVVAFTFNDHSSENKCYVGLHYSFTSETYFIIDLDLKKKVGLVNALNGQEFDHVHSGFDLIYVPTDSAAVVESKLKALLKSKPILENAK